jgi:hypothetical protein
MNRGNLLIYILLCILIFSGCSKLEVLINTQRYFSWEYMPENEKTILVQPSIKINEHKLSEWKPRVFFGNSQLAYIWQKAINKNDLEGDYYASYPDAWDIADSFYVNPLTGEFPVNIKLDDNSSPPRGGITDGNYIFGFYSHKLSQSGCWRIKDHYKIWENLAALTSTKFYIINNNLLHTQKSFVQINRLNPWTGKIIWSISTPKDNDQIISSTPTDKYLFVTIANESHFEIDRINPEDGKADVVLSSENEIKDLTTIEDNLWILFETGELFNFDCESFKQLKSINVGNYNKLKQIDNKLLLSNTDENKYSLFDPSTETITPLDTPSAKVINGSLIFEDDKQLRGIDPDTQETTWWIDLDENMKNAHVEWLDWRGVLVVSDNEIACYAPKK